MPTGAFVARRNGQIFLTGNSGFPKATRIDTQIDAAAFRTWLELHPEERDRLKAVREAERAARRAKDAEATRDARSELRALTAAYKAAAGLSPRVVGQKKHQPKFAAAELGYREKDNGYNSRDRETFDVLEAATEAARYWIGHRYGGQAIKPALEPIIVFQKPYSRNGAVADMLASGAGALWIDGARIGTEEMIPRNNMPGQNGVFNASGGIGNGGIGRWPANLVLSHAADCGDACAPGCPVAALGAQSGERVSGTQGQANPRMIGSSTDIHGVRSTVDHDDTGTAARFFHQSDYMLERLELADAIAYYAKASRAEREAGLDPRQTAIMRLLDDGEDGIEDFEEHADLERISGTRDHTVRRCPNHGKAIPSGSTSYSCGCAIVRGVDFAETTVDDGRDTPIDNPYQRGETTRRNIHPTIKPLSLASHLSKLLLPPPEYGPRRILIPFAGAGSEAIGAMLAGWEDITAVELEQAHVAIAEARMAYWKQRRWEYGDTSRKLTVKSAPDAPKGQLDMFVEKLV